MRPEVRTSPALDVDNAFVRSGPYAHGKDDGDRKSERPSPNLPVSDLLVRYVLGLDRGEWATVAGCFAPDAVFVHPGGRVQGPDAIVARARAALEPLDASQHLLGSVLVTVGGDSARATSYFHAQHVRASAPGGDLFVIAGTYRDRSPRWGRMGDPGAGARVQLAERKP